MKVSLEEWDALSVRTFKSVQIMEVSTSKGCPQSGGPLFMYCEIRSGHLCM